MRVGSFAAFAAWLGCASLGFASLGCDQLGSVAKPEVPLWVHHPGSALSIDARRDLVPNPSDAGEPYERSAPEIDPAHRRVFLGTSDHGVYALSAVNLATLWRFQTAGAVEGQPLYVRREDALYVGSNDGAVYKLRASDGKMLWRFATNGPVVRRPVLAGTTLYVVNGNDTLVAIERDTGKLRWFRQRTPAAGMEIGSHSGPAYKDGYVYVAFSDGIVMAYRGDDGSEAWTTPADLTAEAEQTAGGAELRYLDSDATPVFGTIAGEPAMFVASYEGGIFALDPRTGGQLWRNEKVTGVTDLAIWRGPAPDAGVAVFETNPKAAEKGAGSSGDGSSGDGSSSAVATKPERTVLVASSGLTGLWGLKPEDGVQTWRRELPAGGATAVVPWAGALLLGTTRYGLFLVHPLDGSVLDGIAAGASFAATPAVYGRHAFALSNEGVVMALGIEPPRGTRTTSK